MLRIARALLGRAVGGLDEAPSGAPSFLARREELRRIRVIGHELGVRDPVFAVNGKIDAHAWAVRLGVRPAAVLAHAATPQEIPWASLPPQFVVKPVRGAGSRGVYLLRRHGTGYRDLVRGLDLGPGSVAEQLSALAADGRVSGELVVEELVQDPRRPGLGPVDWKFSTFFGRVGLIEAKATRPGGDPVWKLFDDRWADLGRGYGRIPGIRSPPPNLDSSIQAPVHAGALMSVAQRISAAVPRPFVRVDLYDSVAGPVFGELTPEPGGPVHGFRADIDRFLGHCWEEAEARLMVRGIRAGILAPADGPLPESMPLLARQPGRVSVPVAPPSGESMPARR